MKTSTLRRNRIVLDITLVSLLLLCAASAPPGARLADRTSQEPEKKKEVFTDEDLKVEKLNGSWRAQTVPDLKQAADFSVPVFIKMLNTFWGTGKHLGRMKVPEATLENRSQQVVRSIQLRWTIVDVSDPEKVLLEGLTPFFEVAIEPFTTVRVDIPEIYFNKILKPLMKEGELNGYFRLVVGVQEVRFSDNQVWQRLQAAPF